MFEKLPTPVRCVNLDLSPYPSCGDFTFEAAAD